MKKLFLVTLMIVVSFASFGQAEKLAVPSIGGKTNGQTISKSALVSAGKITLNQSTKQVNFFMMRYMNKLAIVELTSNSSNLTPEMKSAINTLSPGSKLDFLKISCVLTSNANAAPERVGQFSVTIQ